jgi:hypothetical protein
MALERAAGYSSEEIEAVVSEALASHLAAGVTTVRDLGDRHFTVVARRDAQRQVDGLPVHRSPPRVATAGSSAAR